MKYARFLLLLFGSLTHFSYAQVGIGTLTPKAFFNVARGQTVLFGQDSNQVGSQNKLLWYASQGAFRAGAVASDNWSRSNATDNTNVGQYSFASGYNTLASGAGSAAMGYGSQATGSRAFATGNNTIASGGYSTAMGRSTSALGDNAVTMGRSTTALGDYSTAMGYQTMAGGDYSTATGQNTMASGNAAVSMGAYSTASGGNSVAIGSSLKASGINSTAMGLECTASGNTSMAFGFRSTASGYYSMALGAAAIASGDFSVALGSAVNTNNHTGSFTIGDFSNLSSIILNNDSDNQMMMRFGGGYKLFSNADATIGVQLSSGDNSWHTLSDSTRKENFRFVNGADFLQKISRMRLGSWNYKGQDVKMYRHYGPMAQEFFAAFGHDELGTIGEDKSINQADFDGVNLIAIQALIRKVETLEAENQLLRAELGATRQNETSIQSRLDKIEAILQNHSINKIITFKP